MRWRWLVVAALTLGLVSLPLAARLLPGGDSSVGAATLLSRITASGDVGYSGFAESRGTFSLPVDGGGFGALTELFGQTSQLRVWWRGADDWRVDRIDVTGEDDLYRDGDRLQTWNYESDSAAQGEAPQSLRLPRADDALPTTLARRLLSEATADEVSRLPGRRIAGEQTAGLRVRVGDPRSTIETIDVWALPGDGLPLRVEVHARGASLPVFTSAFLDVTPARPAAADTAYRPRPAPGFTAPIYGDLLQFIDQLGRGTPPATLAGLPRRTDLDLGAVGAYGRGATLLVAVPMTARVAGEVVPQVRRAPGAVENATGIVAGLGPLSVALSPPEGFGARWLLVGTLTTPSLVDALPGLPSLRDYRFGYGR